MQKKILTLILSLLTLSNHGFAQQSLANYIGTGSNPDITLVLSPNNGPKWGAFSIAYQGIGGVPWSTNPATNWSPWDVKDQDGNYYGTINLKSDGNTVTWNGYSAGTDGHYLEGIELAYNKNINAYQLTALKIHGGEASKGPFPDAPYATPAKYPGTNTPIILSVAGDSIVNNKGAAILLKGLSRPSLEWDPQGQYLSVQDLENIRNWGSNVIRISLYQDYWFQSEPITKSGSYKQIIDAIVYYATQLNMAVILDLHWTHYGTQSPMADRNSLKFWQEVAVQYKDFGTVMFELYNEPEGITKEVWLKGDKTYAGYQELYDAVRSTGAENICIANGLDYGYDLSFVNSSFKIKGTNIVYGSHPYNEKGSPSWTGPGGSFDNNFKGVLGVEPLIFTEFGVNQASYFPTGYQAVYNRILTYADAHGINYTGFAWWVEVDPAKANVFPCLIKDWSGTPLNGGVEVHNDMQTHPGSANL